MKPVIIFVRPQAQGNVGAIARVMSNFDYYDLRLVNEVAGSDTYGKDDTPFDWGMACGGKSILESLKVYDSLLAATSDIDFVLGTTAQPREDDNGYSREYIDVGIAFKEINQKLNEDKISKWALVIGAESDGLTDHELSFCHKVAFINTSSSNPSMNAAMAAGSMLFYWQQTYLNQLVDRTTTDRPKDPLRRGREEWVGPEEKEQFLNYLMETLALTSFFKYPDHESTRARFRRWMQSFEMQKGELLFAFEALYHLRAKITGIFSKRDFLKNK